MTPNFEAVESGCFEPQLCESGFLKSFVALAEGQRSCFDGLSGLVWGFFGGLLTGCLQIGTFGCAVGLPSLCSWQLFARGWPGSGELMKARIGLVEVVETVECLAVGLNLD